MKRTLQGWMRDRLQSFRLWMWIPAAAMIATQLGVVGLDAVGVNVSRFLLFIDRAVLATWVIVPAIVAWKEFRLMRITSDWSTGGCLAAAGLWTFLVASINLFVVLFLACGFTIV